VPTPGKKRAASKIKDPRRINQSNLRNIFEGMLKAIIVAKTPIIKKMICLDAK
jgi:hypothetical protein